MQRLQVLTATFFYEVLSSVYSGRSTKSYAGGNLSHMGLSNGDGIVRTI